MEKPGPYLRSADVARRLGVSGKALRVYEAQGLVKAERTAAGWRVYGPEQIQRLHQVIALKHFGFALSRIAELLAGGLPDLATFLEMQEAALRQKAQRVDKALQLLSAARAKLAEQGSLSSDELMNLTKETAMTDQRDNLQAAYEAVAAKHFSPDEQARLRANGYGGMDKPDAGWAALHKEAAQLMALGDPRSPEAMDMARRWMSKVFEATGGDPALTRKMKNVARETHETPAFAAAVPSANAMMDFVAEAYGAAITAGVMPKPNGA